MTAYISNLGIVMLNAEDDFVMHDLEHPEIDELGEGEAAAEKELYGDTEDKCLHCGHAKESHRKGTGGVIFECHRMACRCDKYE